MKTKLHDGEKILMSQLGVLYGTPSYEFAGEAGRTPDAFGSVVIYVNIYLTTSRLIFETTQGTWDHRCVEGVTREIPITAIKKMNRIEPTRFLFLEMKYETLQITIEDFEEYDVSIEENIKIIRPKNAKEWVDFFKKNKEHLIKPEIERVTNAKIKKAKKHEQLLEFDEAAMIYKELGMDGELIRVRKLKAEQGSVKVSQKVVQGDYIDDRDTIIKDSVLNRSNVGAGSSKIQELEKLAEMKKEGLISDEEYEKLKQEIIG